MADKPQDSVLANKSMRLIDKDVVQIEFLIDDLIKQLVTDRVSPVAACNGCKMCSSVADLPNPIRGRE